MTFGTGRCPLSLAAIHPPKSLGVRVERSRGATPAQRAVVVLTLLAFLLVINAAVLAVNELVIRPRNGTAAGYNNYPYQTSHGERGDTKPSATGSSWGVTSASPLSRLDDEDFQVYVGYFLWCTVMLAGVGLQLWAWSSLFQEEGCWSAGMEKCWRLSEQLFALAGVTSFAMSWTDNYWALPILVAGLWNYGFPEVLLFMYYALYLPDAQELELSSQWLHRVTDFLIALATVTHHGSASLMVCMFLVKVAMVDRHIISPPLVTLMQHWFVSLRQVNYQLYAVVQLSLEAWFEWNTFSELEYIFANHWTAALVANTMLVAHWLYLIAAGMEMIPDKRKNHRTSRATPSEQEGRSEDSWA